MTRGCRLLSECPLGSTPVCHTNASGSFCSQCGYQPDFRDAWHSCDRPRKSLVCRTQYSSYPSFFFLLFFSVYSVSILLMRWWPALQTVDAGVRWANPQSELAVWIHAPHWPMSIFSQISFTFFHSSKADRKPNISGSAVHWQSHHRIRWYGWCNLRIFFCMYWKLFFMLDRF